MRRKGDGEKQENNGIDIIVKMHMEVEVRWIKPHRLRMTTCPKRKLSNSRGKLHPQSPFSTSIMFLHNSKYSL